MQLMTFQTVLFFYTFNIIHKQANKARFVETFLQLFMHGPLYNIF